MSDKIRILFAIGQMSGGGSQRQLVGILHRLDRSRFAPQLYLISSGGELLPEVPQDVPVHVFTERVGSQHWWQPGKNHLRWLLNIGSIAAHRARTMDLARLLAEQRIEVVYDRTYHMTLIAAEATRRRPTPRISTIVTDPVRDFETNPERLRFFKRLLLQRAYRTADCVACVSEGVRQAAIRHYRLPSQKAETLYNFFDIERADRLMAEPLPPAEMRRQDGRFEIVCAGRLHVQKGYIHLLEAIDDLVHRRGKRQIHLRILGTGSEEGALSAYIASHALAPHVTLVGFRPNPLPYLRQSDLFCLPSLYEGMPNALVEAIVCGVPALATDCPSGPAEILARGQFGRLVPPENPVALADAIEDAITNHDRWRSLTAAARKHIIDNFSPAAGMQKLEELLVRVVATGQRNDDS